MTRSACLGLLLTTLAAAGGCGAEEEMASDSRAFPRPFHVIAHRGASAYAPENTIPAFQRALQLGALEVELDLHLSSDDVLIVFHDETLDTKTDASGRVRDHTADALRRVDIGSWFDRTHPSVPERFAGTPLVALPDVFDAFGDQLVYHLEIKGEEEAIPERLLELLRARGLLGNAVITSFQVEQLRRVRALDAEVFVCLLTKDDPEGAIDTALRERFQQVGIPAEHLTPEIVDRGHAQGLEVRAFRIRTREDMEHAIAVGSNGMTIDWPDWLIARLVEHAAGRGASR